MAERTDPTFYRSPTEISRDGRRVYATNSLYASWDEIFCPEGVVAWMARVDTNTDTGVHQTRLQGGDASSDSYCYVD
jgi:methanethiol oxidase